MIVFLILFIVLLAIAVVRLNIEFYNEKHLFNSRMDDMQQLINKNLQKQAVQRDKVQMSDKLNEKLKSNHAVLSRSIFDLNYELFDLLSKNNLLKRK